MPGAIEKMLQEIEMLLNTISAVREFSRSRFRSFCWTWFGHPDQGTSCIEICAIRSLHQLKTLSLPAPTHRGQSATSNWWGFEQFFRTLGEAAGVESEKPDPSAVSW